MLDLRTADGTPLVGLRETLLHRFDLELALTRVLDVLRRPEEHVDDRPEERREEPEQRRQSDEPRIFDTTACVLERPVRGRKPENDDERDPQVAEEGPVGILERELQRAARRWS